MNLRASIDIGSNSILLLIIEEKNPGFKVVANESHVTGLGRDLDLNGIFSDEAMKESFGVLREYQEICLKYGLAIEQIIATATEASRVAKNAPRFYKKVYDELGLNVQIITGEAEAYYSTIGILIDDKIDEDEITIMDIGGASTELIKVNVANKAILQSFSMPVGAVRMNNWKVEHIQEEKLQDVLKRFSKELESVKTRKLYCVAGTMTSVGNIYLGNKNFIEDEVNGLVFSANELKDIRSKHLDLLPHDFLAMYPFLGKRSQTIASGLTLANVIIDRLDVDLLYISTYGLRYGTILLEQIPDHFKY